MADYHPLLIRAISRLDVNTAAARQSVYANARAALEALLLQDHSPIAEDEFDRERSALEDAIALVEFRTIGSEAEPARSSAPRQKGCHTSVTSEVPCGPEAGAGRSEFLNDIRDDTLDFSEHDPERRMEALAIIAGLPPVDARRDVPTRVPIDPYKRMPTPTLRRPGRSFLGGGPFTVAGAMIAAGAGFFVVAIWPPEMDFTDAPIPVPSETHLVTPPPFPQAGLPPIQPKGRTAEGGASEQELTMSSEVKLAESGIEVRSPAEPPAAEYRTNGDASSMPGSNLVHQASPTSSADAASDGQDSKPSCFPSASAVRQDYPEAWPSWTLRAPGHEGTKCWYAATRTAVHDPRGGIMATASGETSAMPGSNSVHPASPRSSADAASDGQDTKPLIERERPFVAASAHDSTCFPSASAVRQEYPEARPSWTLRAPGHEGTKCWYAATRATVYDH